jgi:SAM-dependent methyltransferase
LRDYRLRIDDVLWNIVQCRKCSLGYLNPRPTMTEIGRYYPASYFAHRGGTTKRYERQARYLDQVAGRDLLDIGAARGDFLHAMRARGWAVAGIEPWAKENPHNLTILDESFPDECSLPEESFDVVTAWAVFEHLHDPRKAFAQAARLLRPDGTLVLQVPNLRSINARLARLEDVPRHLYFFNPDTLRRYGLTAGLRLDRIVHTTDMYGGSGRGVLRLALTRATGGTQDEFFDFYRLARRERFRRRPVLASAWTAVGLLERVVISDRLVRAVRISGEVVALYRKDARLTDARTSDGDQAGARRCARRSRSRAS